MLATVKARCFTRHMYSEKRIPKLPTPDSYAQAIAELDIQIRIFGGVTNMLNADGERRRYNREAYIREVAHEGMLRSALRISTNAETITAFSRESKIGALAARAAHGLFIGTDDMRQYLIGRAPYLPGIITLSQRGINLIGTQNEQNIDRWSTTAMPNGAYKVTFKAGLGLLVYGAHLLHSDLLELQKKAATPGNWNRSLAELTKKDTSPD